MSIEIYRWTAALLATVVAASAARGNAKDDLLRRSTGGRASLEGPAAGDVCLLGARCRLPARRSAGRGRPRPGQQQSSRGGGTYARRRLRPPLQEMEARPFRCRRWVKIAQEAGRST